AVGPGVRVEGHSAIPGDDRSTVGKVQRTVAQSVTRCGDDPWCTGDRQLTVPETLYLLDGFRPPCPSPQERGDHRQGPCLCQEVRSARTRVTVLKGTACARDVLVLDVPGHNPSGARQLRSTGS